MCENGKAAKKGGNFEMTANQIAYQKHLEDKRSNFAKEAETARSNKAAESETNRANLARERETYRHNLATEGYNTQYLAETQRSNLANELLKQQQVDESKRSNVAQENIKTYANVEQARSNLAEEEIKKQQNTINQQNADTNRYNAHINLGNAITGGFRNIGQGVQAFSNRSNKTIYRTGLAQSIMNLLQ